MPETMKVYWRKIRPDEGIMAHWAELGHALMRLKFVADEFELSMNNLTDLESIYRVLGQLANYHACVYELQERLFAFVAAMTKTSKKQTKGILLKSSKEGVLLSALPTNAKECAEPLKQVIRELSNDVEIRNIHTHETFVRLAVSEGPRWIDIEDLWWELEEDAGSMRNVFRLMSKQGSRLVSEYKSRAECIYRSVDNFLKVSLPYLSEASV
jgi:hypothetical protein